MPISRHLDTKCWPGVWRDCFEAQNQLLEEMNSPTSIDSENDEQLLRQAMADLRNAANQLASRYADHVHILPTFEIIASLVSNLELVDDNDLASELRRRGYTVIPPRD